MMGYEMGSALNFSMPVEWSTFSITGGQPALHAVDGSLSIAEIGPRTNRFGHFRTFYFSTNRTIDEVNIDAQGHWIDNASSHLSIAGCGEANMRSRLVTLETHYFSSEGLTIVSDVDDILRVAEIWNPKQMIFNTFVRAFRPWLEMPQIYGD
jgi:hypothetical protein